MQQFPENDDELNKLQANENEEISMDHNDELQQLIVDVGINYEPTNYTETEEEDMLELV